MKDIFFEGGEDDEEEEEFFPTDGVTHMRNLVFIYKSYRLKSIVDDALAYDLARKLESSGSHPVKEVCCRTLKLLDFQCRWPSLLALGPKKN